MSDLNRHSVAYMSADADIRTGRVQLRAESGRPALGSLRTNRFGMVWFLGSFQYCAACEGPMGRGWQLNLVCGGRLPWSNQRLEAVAMPVMAPPLPGGEWGRSVQLFA